jgi:cobalamin biosynthetic protein CobC
MEHFKIKPTGSFLFKTIQHNNAPQIFKALCQQGVYVRLCDENNALRFGIPSEKQFSRLTKVIQNTLK